METKCVLCSFSHIFCSFNHQKRLVPFRFSLFLFTVNAGWTSFGEMTPRGGVFWSLVKGVTSPTGLSSATSEATARESDAERTAEIAQFRRCAAGPQEH